MDQAHSAGYVVYEIDLTNGGRHCANASGLPLLRRSTTHRRRRPCLLDLDQRVPDFNRRFQWRADLRARQVGDGGRNRREHAVRPRGWSARGRHCLHRAARDHSTRRRLRQRQQRNSILLEHARVFRRARQPSGHVGRDQYRVDSYDAQLSRSRTRSSATRSFTGSLRQRSSRTSPSVTSAIRICSCSSDAAS